MCFTNKRLRHNQYLVNPSNPNALNINAPLIQTGRMIEHVIQTTNSTALNYTEETLDSGLFTENNKINAQTVSQFVGAYYNYVDEIWMLELLKVAQKYPNKDRFTVGPAPRRVAGEEYEKYRGRVAQWVQVVRDLFLHLETIFDAWNIPSPSDVLGLCSYQFTKDWSAALGVLGRSPDVYQENGVNYLRISGIPLKQNIYLGRKQVSNCL